MAVALPRQVDPVGVAKLVAHEGEVGVARESTRQQPRELVEGDATLDDGARGQQRRHAVVEACAHQPLRERLVAHHRLVVTLYVRQPPLLAPPFAERGDNLADREATRVGQEPDPHRRDVECLPKVEADASRLERCAQPRHARILLSNRQQRRRPEPVAVAPRVSAAAVAQQVGEREVGHRGDVDVRMRPKVLRHRAMEGAAAAEAAVAEEGRRDRVKAKTVESVRGRKPADVGEEEAEHLDAAVVKEPRAPHGVLPRGSARKKGRVVAVGGAQSAEALARVA
mmetsp:Transcript_11341/g.29947  ORF Transcript_11341/g.29947 Transcript_11341/m.29947 type:complete len:283 (+) Transcript_11341:788-1636(+)